VDDELEPCLVSILCALASPAAAGLVAVVDALEADALRKLSQNEAYRAARAIAAVPAQAVLGTAAVANEAINSQIRPLTQFLPVGALAQCGDAGRILREARQFVDDAQGELNEFTTSLARQLSLVDELDQLIMELQGQIDFFQSIKDALRNCA
jgi:hypothetical protein